MKNLVIVESPTKARTIGRFLGGDFEIKSSMGHVMDLPKSKLGVDIEHDFKPEYELLNDKKKIAQELKDAAKNAGSIILATDPDREGEAIASHVRDMLGSSSKFNPSTPLRTRVQSSKFQRIVFHEITKEAIEEAIKSPRSIDKNLVDAQTARRVLDRLVGYKLSPLLWQKIRRGLSAGRVQSVALRLIVEREREIEKFKIESYWSITALLSKGSSVLETQNHGTKLNYTQNNAEKDSSSAFGLPRGKAGGTQNDNRKTEFELIEINGEKIETQEVFNLYDGEYRITKTIIGEENKANEIVADLKTKKFEVSDVIKKEVRKSPQPPFTTSTLQQDAARRFGFSGKRTMAVAQKLYEEGFITYHRTDSLNLSSSAVSAMRKFISQEYGDKFLPENPRFYKTKQKSAQEAHEAIRPTKIGQISKIQDRISNLGRDHLKLYELIWRRGLGSQMADAITESTTVIVDTKSVILGNEETPESDSGQARMTKGKYRLKANGSVLIFEGFLKVNPQALQDKKLPEFTVSAQLEAENILAEKHETPPPPRYNDASLIKTLEEKDIGRPSTYATIISTIESRRYIERDQGKFLPTTVGIAVNDFLVENFSEVDDIPFTAEMENELDSIANGEKEWVPMIKKFYIPFEKKLESAKGSERVKIEVEQTDEKCEKCQAPMVIRIGKYGKFLSCSRFPDCDFSKAFIQDTGLTCPKCASLAQKDESRRGGKVIVRKTRKGRTFYGCSNYPACDFAAWKLEDIKKENTPKTS